MIERIKLENFEGHVDTELNLKNGVYLINGKTDSGKSSLLRAIRFVLYNKPSNEEKVINFNANECSVTLWINGHEIKRTRARGNKVNSYFFDGKELKAFGMNVPSDILNSFDLSLINFEWQFDRKPFMLSETGGEVAKKLNERVNLEIIDKSLKNVDSKKRTKNKELEIHQKKQEELTASLISFDFLNELNNKINELNNNYNEFNNKSVKLNGIINIYDKINELNNKLNNSNNIISDEVIKDLTDKVNHKVFFNNKIYGLSPVIDSINRCEEFSKNFQQKFAQLDKKILDVNNNNTSLVNKYNNLLKISSLIQKLNTLSEEGDKISNISINDRFVLRLDNKTIELDNNKKTSEELTKLINNIDLLKTKSKEVLNELEAIHEEYKSLNIDACPLCGAKLDGAFIGI